jgi:hypothetical protein
MVIAEETTRVMDGTTERLMAAWRDLADEPRTRERETSSLSTHSELEVSEEGSGGRGRVRVVLLSLASSVYAREANQGENIEHGNLSLFLYAI